MAGSGSLDLPQSSKDSLQSNTHAYMSENAHGQPGSTALGYSSFNTARTRLDEDLGGFQSNFTSDQFSGSGDVLSGSSTHHSSTTPMQRATTMSSTLLRINENTPFQGGYPNAVSNSGHPAGGDVSQKLLEPSGSDHLNRYNNRLVHENAIASSSFNEDVFSPGMEGHSEILETRDGLEFFTQRPCIALRGGGESQHGCVTELMHGERISELIQVAPLSRPVLGNVESEFGDAHVPGSNCVTKGSHVFDADNFTPNLSRFTDGHQEPRSDIWPDPTQRVKLGKSEHCDIGCVAEMGSPPFKSSSDTKLTGRKSENCDSALVKDLYCDSFTGLSSEFTSGGLQPSPSSSGRAHHRSLEQSPGSLNRASGLFSNFIHSPPFSGPPSHENSLQNVSSDSSFVLHHTPSGSHHSSSGFRESLPHSGGRESLPGPLSSDSTQRASSNRHPSGFTSGTPPRLFSGGGPSPGSSGRLKHHSPGSQYAGSTPNRLPFNLDGMPHPALESSVLLSILPDIGRSPSNLLGVHSRSPAHSQTLASSLPSSHLNSSKRPITDEVWPRHSKTENAVFGDRGSLDVDTDWRGTAAKQGHFDGSIEASKLRDVTLDFDPERIIPGRGENMCNWFNNETINSSVYLKNDIVSPTGIIQRMKGAVEDLRSLAQDPKSDRSMAQTYSSPEKASACSSQERMSTFSSPTKHSSSSSQERQHGLFNNENGEIHREAVRGKIRSRRQINSSLPPLPPGVKRGRGRPRMSLSDRSDRRGSRSTLGRGGGRRMTTDSFLVGGGVDGMELAATQWDSSEHPNVLRDMWHASSDASSVHQPKVSRGGRRKTLDTSFSSNEFGPRPNSGVIWKRKNVVVSANYNAAVVVPRELTLEDFEARFDTLVRAMRRHPPDEPREPRFTAIIEDVLCVIKPGRVKAPGLLFFSLSIAHS